MKLTSKQKQSMYNKEQDSNKCSKCLWGHQCSETYDQYIECDDFTTIYSDDDDTGDMDYIESQQHRDEFLSLWSTQNKHSTYNWSDSIAEAFLNGEDVTDDKWWGKETKYREDINNARD